MALLFIGNGSALYYKDKMSIKRNREYEVIDGRVFYGEDFRRIRSHVKNEVGEKKEEKYKQLEFEFDEDLVAPI